MVLESYGTRNKETNYRIREIDDNDDDDDDDDDDDVMMMMMMMMMMMITIGEFNNSSNKGKLRCLVLSELP